MFFALEKSDDPMLFSGKTLAELLLDITENCYDGTDAIPNLSFFQATPIKVKFEQKLSIIKDTK